MVGNGHAASSVVDSIDLFPTLAALAALPAPKALKGQSLVPILQNPSVAGKNHAFSEFPAPALSEWAAKPLSPGMRETFYSPLIEQVAAQLARENRARYERKTIEEHVKGYSVRTADFRYTRWIERRVPNSAPFAEELYDHRHDPRQMINVAGTREYATRVAELARLVRQITQSPTER